MKKLLEINENYGRVFLIVAGLLIWLVILCLFKVRGYDQTWELWRVPVEHPPFSDFRLIPGSAETFRLGIDPSQRNPGDPHHRKFNYPAFWRLFFYTNITQEDTSRAVLLLLGLFFAAVFLFPQRISVVDAFYLLLVVFSPAAMLLYERGNVDLFVFFLCTLIVLTLEYSALVATLLLMLATIVKFFPFFGVSVLLRESKPKFLRFSIASFFVLALYIFETSGSMEASWDLTMRGKEISYGAYVFFMRYFQNSTEHSSIVLTVGPIALALILVVTSGILGIISQVQLPIHSARNLAAFRMGASIYVGTFLLGNNWDYRLTFLIFVVPQLTAWSRNYISNSKRYVAAFTLMLVLASCWHFVVWYAPGLAYMRELIFQLDELVNWLLLMFCSYLLMVSSPKWLKDIFWGPVFGRSVAGNT